MPACPHTCASPHSLGSLVPLCLSSLTTPPLLTRPPPLGASLPAGGSGCGCGCGRAPGNCWSPWTSCCRLWSWCWGPVPGSRGGRRGSRPRLQWGRVRGTPSPALGRRHGVSTYRGALTPPVPPTLRHRPRLGPSFFSEVDAKATLALSDHSCGTLSPQTHKLRQQHPLLTVQVGAPLCPEGCRRSQPPLQGGHAPHGPQPRTPARLLPRRRQRGRRQVWGEADLRGPGSPKP